MTDQATVSTTDSGVPPAVDAQALLDLADGYHSRVTRSLGSRELAGHLVKTYAIEAPGRTLTTTLHEAADRLAAAQLRLDRAVGGLGIGCLIVHSGGDGDYVLLLSWIEGCMSRLAIFTGPKGQPELLRPAPAGLAPCIWEAAVLAHERDAFVRRILQDHSPVVERLQTWTADVFPSSDAAPITAVAPAEPGSFVVSEAGDVAGR
jgi:hypothetical protein